MHACPLSTVCPQPVSLPYLILYDFFLQAAWTLKTRALTEQVYVDEVEVDEEGIAEMMMDDNSIATVARPGTSLKKPGTSQTGPSQGVRWVGHMS